MGGAGERGAVEGKWEGLGGGRPGARVVGESRVGHERAAKWAKRVMGRKGSGEERLRMLHEQAFGRDATEGELEWGRKALKELGPENSEEGWTAFCHLMINRKEFIYVF